MKKTQTRFLIVGQGIAGTMLAYSLICRGLMEREDFLLVDAGLDHSSSLISTGVLNPVVFKRMTLSWGSELLPGAWELYEGLELFLNEQGPELQFLHKMELLHLFRDEAERRLCDNAGPELWAHLGERFSADDRLQSVIAGKYGGVLVNDSGWVESQPLLKAFRSYLHANNQLIEAELELEDLSFREGLWQGPQEDISFNKIILCTGIQYRYSFDYRLPDHDLPFYPVKGDILTLHLPGLEGKIASTERIIGNKVMLQPLPGQRGFFRVGSSYIRDFSNTAPSPEGIRWILSELAAMGLASKAELEQAMRMRQAGIRPASRNRLAYLGPLHASEKTAGLYDHEQRVLVFNGLGTRGFMLAPGLSEKLADYLLDSVPLPQELAAWRHNKQDLM